jgi:predicted dehydrogenase
MKDEWFMEMIRWGIIGCGDVTEVKSGPGFQKARASSLVAVMRRHGDLAADYARRHGVPRWYDDAEALVHDPDVDAVYIATPPAHHGQYTLLCARAGKPVYVEKPMGRTYAECQEMIRACREAGVPLFVAYYRRALPRFLKVKELIESGALGEVRCVTINLSRTVPPGGCDPENLPWRLIPEIAGGGLFMDLACHTLDFLDYALGPIQEVRGLASNQGGHYRAEDMVSGTFRFESGVHGVGTWCFTSFERVDVNEIVGTEGKVRFSSFGVEPVVLETSAGLTEFPIANPPHVQQPLIQAVVDDLLGIGACPSTGVSAARTNWVMDRMLEGYRQAADQ